MKMLQTRIFLHQPITKSFINNAYLITLKSRSLTTSTILNGPPKVNIPVLHRILQFHDRIALADQRGEHSYSQLYLRSNALSKLLKSSIESPNTKNRIALFCPNDSSYVVSQWATWLTGNTAVPLSPHHPASQLEYYLNDSEASLIITTQELLGGIEPALSGQQVLVIEKSLLDDQSVDLSSCQEPNHSNEYYEDDDAMILYTSGTTGPPKGVVLTHQNILSQVSCLHQAWGWTSRDVILHCLPLHHVHGIINVMLGAFYAGARVEMERKFDATKVWSKILALDTPVENRVNLFMAVPTIYAKLIQEYKEKFANNPRMKEFVKSVCTQNIRLMVSGSAALPEVILNEWQNITGHTLLERYGMTEIGMALSNPLKGLRKPGFVGQPLPGVEVCIGKFEDDSSKEYDPICFGNSKNTTIMPDKEQEAGELLVKGPNVFREYWKKPNATEKEFTHDGWFRTGDTAQYIDGSYKILGRSSVDIIKSGGFKISALDVERIYLEHPNIRDIAVVGIPDLTWGQKIAAILVWDSEEKLDTVSLRKWGKDRMPHYQIPLVYVQVEDQLPRNNMGKVNKKQIIQQFFPENKE